MAMQLATMFKPYVDEMFSTESKIELVTNQDFDWTGARSIKLYKITTSEMNDYDRNGKNATTQWSRYGVVKDLTATTEELALKKDRSFTFVVDKLDNDETLNTLEAASALARQVREVVIPEVDKYTYGVMAEKAGTKPEAIELTPENIYGEIIKANKIMDDEQVPETERVLIVTPATYMIMKQSKEIVLDTNVGSELRRVGVIGNLDGVVVEKVPAVRLPEKCGFMLCHRCATAAPTKLEQFTTHHNPPGISGNLVEGRICYDAFVLDNKAKAIYYQAIV